MLTIEELTVIKMYKKDTRKETLSHIKVTIPYYAENEKEQVELIVSTVRKLNAMSNDSFDNLDLSESLDYDDEINVTQ